MRAGLFQPPGYRFERHGAAVLEERHDREVEKRDGAEGAAPPHEFFDSRNAERLQAIAVSILRTHEPLSHEAAPPSVAALGPGRKTAWTPDLSRASRTR